MNVYRLLGDRIGTVEARDLSERLVAWHDSMVKHLRIVSSRGAAACGDGCPHDDAAGLWAEALDVYGPAVVELRFLMRHGGDHVTIPPPARTDAAQIA